MLKNLTIFTVCLPLIWAHVLNAGVPQLTISADQRHIVTQNGKPLFYLGDTAWELFHRLNREEADLYLKNRAEKGFTVIQAVVLAELDGLFVPNPYGHLPLENNDPTRPVEQYFQHVDYIVNKAEALGIFIGMLPTWGDKFNKKWGRGPEIFTPENAKIYGEFLGKRYKSKPIIWILGGDRSPENEQHLAIIRAMAQGLGQGDGGSHLMTYHPMGGTNSSEWFHQDQWLDFNMFQSGHGTFDNPNYNITTNNYHLKPVKPTIDGEPRYEDHPVNWRPANGWFDEFDVRQAAYWSMLAGAAGHTYGNHNIWQIWQPGREPISSARTPWRQAIDYPGAFQMGYLRQLFESRAWQKLEPAQQIIKDAPNTGGQDIRAAVGSFLMVYIPYGTTIKLSLEKISGNQIRVWWFNPRNNTCIRVGQMDKPGEFEFDPPADAKRGNDWVLVVDDVNANFGKPGR